MASGLLSVSFGSYAATPSLSYKLERSDLTITYTGILYQSSDAVHWSEVGSASSPYKVKAINKKLFFCAKGESGGSEEENFTISLSGTVNLDMIWCPAGTFTMGSPEDELGRYSDETQHAVTISRGFWMGKYEVTQAQYKVVMENNPSWFRGNNLPVEQVNWYDAMEFCQKLTQIEKSMGRLPADYEYTLPTEAQWEYACRAGTTAAFNNGTNIPTEEQIGYDYYDDHDNLHQGELCPNLDSIAWYYHNAGTYKYTSHPVGQKLPNHLFSTKFKFSEFSIRMSFSPSFIVRVSNCHD